MVGRKEKINKLNELYSSDKVELIAIYDRRRIGKTYLVDETFKDHFTFRHASLSSFDEDNNNLLDLICL